MRGDRKREKNSQIENEMGRERQKIRQGGVRQKKETMRVRKKLRDETE